MPARTSAAVAPKAPKCFKFLDVMLLSPFVLNIADGFGRCADYRRHSEIARFLAHGDPLLAKKQIAFNPRPLTSRTLMAHTAK
jgi:hypothetical protein